jgi:ubiquinone biosynthesis protein UbiJ
MTPSVLLAGAEIALNRYLRLEPSVIQDCARLAGRCLELRLTGLDLRLVVEFMETGVRVLPEVPVAPQVTLTGSPTVLLGALRRVATGDHSLPAGLIVEGDAELLQTFRGLLTRVGFDPEEWLAPLLGGAAAHRLVGGLRRMFNWGRSNTGRLADQGAEYLREETYDLARGRDVEGWMNQVDDTRDQLDRLEARLRRLEQAGATR